MKERAMQVTIARTVLIGFGVLLILSFFFPWQNGVPTVAIAFFDPIAALLHPTTVMSKSYDFIITCTLSLLSVARGMMLVVIVLSNLSSKRYA
jgi:hypothetical protein